MKVLRRVGAGTCFLLLAGEVFLPAPAAWACGPSSTTTGTAVGGIGPLQKNDLRVLRAKVEIRLLDDGNHYQARASYRLVHDGPARSVQFGIPLLVHSGDESAGQNIALAVKRIQVRYRGKPRRCKPTRPRRIDSDAPATEIGPSPDEEFARSWCRLRLVIPQAEPVEVEVRYRGELEYVDEASKGSGEPRYTPRRLRFAPFPGKRWRTVARQVELIVDLASFAGLGTIRYPRRLRASRGVYQATLRDVALARPPRIDLQVRSHLAPRHRRYVSANRNVSGRVVRASSSLGKRYAAERAVDGKGSSAWCEGRKGNGVGEWLEMEVGSGWPSVGTKFALVPGYVKSQRTYLTNNRIRKVRVSLCGAPGVSADFTFELPRRYDHALQILKMPARILEGLRSGAGKGDCLRFTILEVVKGTKYADTCVSELAPLELF